MECTLSKNCHCKPVVEDYREAHKSSEIGPDPKRIKKADLFANDLCICKHKRKAHQEIRSINFTQGRCEKCKCLNFQMSNQSNQ